MNIVKKIAFPLLYTLILPLAGIASIFAFSLYESVAQLSTLFGRVGLLESFIIPTMVALIMGFITHVALLNLIEKTSRFSVVDHIRHCFMIYIVLFYFAYTLLSGASGEDAHMKLFFALIASVVPTGLITMNAIFLAFQNKRHTTAAC